MNNWKIKKLRDIAEINPKETLKKGSVCKKISMDKLIPYCRDIDDFELDAFNGGAKFRNGDTIMARITPCLENGKISQINCLNQDEVGFGSTEFIVFRAKEGVDKDFLYYLIISDLVKQPAIKSMVGSSGRQRVQNDVVADLDIKIPELSEQIRIGALLKVLDDKIHINGQINKNLYKLIKLNSTLFFSSLKASEIKTVFLSEIADFVSGYSYKGDELKCSDIAMATIKNFDRKGGFKIDGYKEIIPSSKLKSSQFVDDFDSLVAHTDITQNADVIGNAEIVLSNVGYKKLIFSMDLVKVIPKGDKISKFVIATLLQRADFKNHCLSYVNGTTVLHLSKKALPSYELSLPRDENKLIKLNAKIEPLFKLISNNFNENLKLKSLKESLLTKLISGEIDINNPNK